MAQVKVPLPHFKDREGSYPVHRSVPLHPILTQFNPSHIMSVRSILILPSHLRLGLQRDLLLWGFQAKPLYTLLSSVVRVTWFKYHNNISRSSSLCNFPNLGPNVLLSTPFSDTLSLCSSISMRDRILNLHRKTGKVNVKVKVKLFLCLTKYHAMKTHSLLNLASRHDNVLRVEVQLHAFLSSALYGGEWPASHP
jgi:hypothetical protein